MERQTRGRGDLWGVGTSEVFFVPTRISAKSAALIHCEHKLFPDHESSWFHQKFHQRRAGTPWHNEKPPWTHYPVVIIVSAGSRTS